MEERGHRGQITRQRGMIHAPGCRLCQKKKKNSFVAPAYPAPLTHAGGIRAFVQENSGFGYKGGGGSWAEQGDRWLIDAGSGQVKWCLSTRSAASQRPRGGLKGPESELTLVLQETRSNLDGVVRRPQTRTWRADGGTFGERH